MAHSQGCPDRQVSAIHDALKKNPSLTFHYISDFLRSTREHPRKCSASLLAPLKASFPDRVFLSLYHTPNLNGIVKQLVPRRFDEGWGLWHAKAYIADDDVLISGANLSKDYFTNRQDRYMHIADHPRLADYFHDFVQTSQSISYSLDGQQSTSWPASNQAPEASWSKCNENKERSAELYKDLQARWITNETDEGTDTQMRPFLQMGHYGIKEETELVVPELLQLGDEGVDRIDWTSGYFSLDQANQRRLLDSPAKEIKVVCASPLANGFYGSAGVSKYIPPAYTRAEQRFWTEVERRQLQDKVELREWGRDNWTYHAKGIWLSAANDQPFATVIGSSNYGPRSATRDMEANLLVTTSNADLKQQLGNEVRKIAEHATKVDAATFEAPDRKVGLGVRFSAWVIRDML